MPLLIPEIFRVVPDVRIVVVDDNSPDGTGDVVRSLTAQYPRLSLFSRPRKEGLGAAYKDALRHALATQEADPIILMDADGSHGVQYLPQIIAASRAHDLVVGSRYVEGGGIERWEWWRYLLSRLGNVYARFLTGLSLKDLTSGFVCIRAPSLREVDLSRMEASGYAFQIDLKYRLIAAGARAREVPIIFQARRGGESKMSHHIITEGLRVPLKIFLERLFT